MTQIKIAKLDNVMDLFGKNYLALFFTDDISATITSLYGNYFLKTYKEYIYICPELVKSLVLSDIINDLIHHRGEYVAHYEQTMVYPKGFLNKFTKVLRKVRNKNYLLVPVEYKYYLSRNGIEERLKNPNRSYFVIYI